MSFNKKNFNLNLKIKHILCLIFIFALIFAFINGASSAEVNDADMPNDNTLLITESDDLSQYEEDVLSANSVHNIKSSANP